MRAIYESGYKHTNSFDLQTNISLQYNVPWVKGLSVKVRGAYDYTTSHNKNLNTPYSTYIHKMPTPRQQIGLGLKQTISWRHTANGINLGEGQYKVFTKW
ncbi:hypothetical protein NXW94_30065 [Bacteroides ovatus]|nr:hypothetical protein [Bacteroides ovatus]